MRRRSSTVELANFFFEPLQLHLQPADLLVEFLLAFLRLRGVRLAGEHLGQPLRGFLLPLADLDWMHAMPGGDRVNRLDALQGIKSNLGFELGTVLTSLL